jgi:hypothetical protein
LSWLFSEGRGHFVNNDVSLGVKELEELSKVVAESVEVA